MSGVTAAQKVEANLIVSDTQAQGVAAQSLAAGTWTRVRLQTVDENTIAGASLAGEIITLPAGDYRPFIMVPTFRSNGMKTRLLNDTTVAPLVFGTTGTGHSSYNGMSYSIIRKPFTLIAQTNLRLEAISLYAAALGMMWSVTGSPEIYAIAEFHKL